MSRSESVGSGVLFILLGIGLMLVADELAGVFRRINEKHFGGRQLVPVGGWGLRVIGLLCIAIGAAMVARAITGGT